MSGRPHRDRLFKELNEIRTELAAEAARIQPEEFDWAPRPGMKSIKALLLEIGTMEKICIHWLAEQTMLSWPEIEEALSATAQDPATTMETLGKVREGTLRLLQGYTEERIQTPVAVPEEWRQYWGTEIEPEEAFRWVGRHEYYHLGQIISYRWILGDNPCKR